MRVRGLLALLAFTVVVAAGCSSDSGSGSSPSVVTETVTTEAAPEPSAASDEVADEEPVSEPAPEDEDSGSTSSGSIEVPDVVGEDHQLAQDTMQAAGLYSLSEEDATGQGRMLIVDRNWTVVEQSPPAGSTVSEDETIVLRSKKDDE